MIFGGLQKNSFIDYPGKVSCVLFLSGCNFDCPYCHNPELIRGGMSYSPPLEEEKIFDFLEERKSLLDGVVISGGEPTVNKDLGYLCKKIKQMGYPVKLDTNGSRPRVLRQLVDEGLVDYMAMDIKTDPSNYAPLIQRDCNPDDLLESIRIIMESAVDYEFRTTCVSPLVDLQTIENISKLIEGAMLYALQRFNRTKVLHPDFFCGTGFDYDDRGLMHLKFIADPWVQECIIR